MSRKVAEMCGVLDRWQEVDPKGYEGGTGVADVTEDELTVGFPGARVVWGEPDNRGWYEPSVTSR